VQSGRNANTSEIIPNPTTFPDGISGTADKVHGLGLKMGIYSSAGTATCAGYPASLGYEDIDAASFAAWGIDYLKYDNCNYPSQWNDQYGWCIPNHSSDVGPNGTCLDITNPAPPVYNWATSNSTKRYNRMRDALLAQNRTIQFSMCIWGTADVQSWANGTGSSYRMSEDIEPNWARILLILNEASFIMNYVGFW
jgi:alpha-galactosidase